MALTTCRECKQNVSRSARTCPHCGVPRSGLLPLGTRIFFFLAFLAILAIFAKLHHAITPEPRASSTTAPIPR